jgi:CubicO group peptidase (beta-lactamase class C family)
MRRLALVFLLLGVVHAKAGLDGEWTLVLERPGMQPRIQKGVLVLERTGKKWSGSLRFPTILYARRHALSDVRVRRGRLRFKLVHAEFTLEFDGRQKRDGLAGECTWKGLGTYPWSATRAGADVEAAEPQARFEKGLRFDRDLPRGDAEQMGFDGRALDRLLRAARDARTDALLIVKDGRIVCERYFRGRRGRLHLMSVTKFLTAMAIALLIDEGRIASLDAPLSTWFEEWKEGRKAGVTLRHVMAHTSGLRHGRDRRGRPSAAELNRQTDKVAYARRLPLEDEPGTKFAYNNEAIALLSGVITKAAGDRRLGLDARRGRPHDHLCGVLHERARPGETRPAGRPRRPVGQADALSRGVDPDAGRPAGQSAQRALRPDLVAVEGSRRLLPRRLAGPGPAHLPEAGPGRRASAGLGRQRGAGARLRRIGGPARSCRAPPVDSLGLRPALGGSTGWTTQARS